MLGRRIGSWIDAIALALAVLLGAAAAGDEPDPFRPLTPPQEIGGMVSVVGAPLPPVPRESVRDAIGIYEMILDGVRLVGPPAAVARGCGFLATMYAAVGESKKARDLFNEAERILVKHGSNGRDLAWVSNNRGLVQLREGEYADALRLFRKAATVLAGTGDELLEPRAIVLQNLASAYDLVGDPENAETAYLTSLDILRAMRNEGSATHQNVRGNLGRLYAGMGDFAEARNILEKLLGERGISQPLRFQVLNTLGYALMNLRSFPESEARLLEAKKIAAGNEQKTIVLLNLAAMYASWRDSERAEAAGAEALQLARRLHGENSRTAAAAMGTLGSVALGRGDLMKADRLFTQAHRILSKRSGDLEAFIFTTRGLALVAQLRGQTDRAKRLSREALDLAKKHLEQMLAFGSETQRLGYQSQAASYDQLANLGDADLLAEAVVAMKGAVLESLLAERALARKAQAPADLEQLDSIHALKIEIMEKIGRGLPTGELQRELKKAQAVLAKRLASRPYPTRPRTDLETVRAALDSGEVLVELIRYEHYGERGALVPSYGGIVIPRTGSLRWVPLGAAEETERQIEELLGHFERGGRSAEVQNPADADVVATLRALNDRLWLPLTEAVPDGTTRVVLSPDAATSFVPWAGLLDANEQFLAERWQLTQVGASRDLVRSARTSQGNTLVAFGDGSGDLQYSRTEVRKIGQAAEKLGWRVTLLLGDAAAENDLHKHPRPGILHLATHGGQLRGDAAQVVRNRLSTNPMYRGYLLLGGGSKTLETWKSGANAPFSNDGVLTAEEAGSLDLSETWLTVLSACETGSGDVRKGEGVLGLRRGFTLAGTENLLVSLWSVRDDATAEFMSAFYDRLFATRDPVQAFQDTQRAELLRWKRERNVPSAVYRAGAFVLTQ